MKSRWIVIFIVLAAFFLLGMGTNQGEKPGEIPVPDKEVTVLLTDNEGRVLNLTQFSINGQAVLTGKLGAGRVALPFGQIRVVHLSPEPKGLMAKVELADQSQMNLSLEKGLTAYGKIKVGTYNISLDQVRKIEIQAVNERKKEKDRI